MRRVGVRAVTGHITIVQEGRFRLVADSGQVFLLTLAHDANVDAEELDHFRHQHTHLRVEYAGEPNMDTAVVRTISSALEGERESKKHPLLQ